MSDALERTLDSARAGRESSLADLIEELRIPSVSTDPSHHDACLKNAEWLGNRFDALGFETKIVDVIAGGNPVVHAELINSDAPLLTIYGHYDVQPPEPLDEWRSDPFDPAIEGDVIVARGCADNKGNHMAALKAAEHWIATEGPPVNLRFLIEGEEEIGGEALPQYLRESGDGLKSDFVLLWDGGFTSDNRPALYAGMRGSMFAEVEVRGPSHDVHSGSYGGAAPNPLIELARLIADLKDQDGRVTIPGFYDDIAEIDHSERARWHESENLEARLKELTGASALPGEKGFDLQERMWSRPTLDLTGIIGGFTGEGQKTIIPAKALAKVSCRLVTDQDPDRIFELLKKAIQGNVREGFSVEITQHSKSAPISVPIDHKGAQAAEKAYQESFGMKPAVIRSGGSIPVAIAFQEAIGAPMVVGGLAHAESRVHSPNECLLLDNFHRGIEMLIRFMHHLGTK